MNHVETIAIGQTIICHTGGSHFKVGYIVNRQSNEWGTHCRVLVTMHTADGLCGELCSAHNIGDADMKGIGWKLATNSEIERAASYAQSHAQEAASNS